MIVHIIRDDKFTADFIKFINANYEKNYCLVFSSKKKLSFNVDDDLYHRKIVIIQYNIRSIVMIIFYILKAEKIIIHGMFNQIIMILILILRASSKSYWCIWGADLYSYHSEKKSLYKIKRLIISQLKGIITQVEGDYELARQYYYAKCKYYHCLLYVSNVFCDSFVNSPRKRGKEKIEILIGHYSHESGRHGEIINALQENSDYIFHIPISYGDVEYAYSLQEKYASNDNIIFYKNFMSYEMYLKIIDNIDVAIFAYERQQACGNIIQLLGRGVTVYLNPEVTTWKWLTNMGIKLFNVNDIYEGKIGQLSNEEKEKNITIIKKYASYDNLKMQWSNILDE